MHRLSRELSDRGVSIRVVCPLARFNRRVRFCYLARGGSRVVDGVDVSYVPYANVPHGLSPEWDGTSLERRIRQAIEPGWRPDVIQAHRLFPTGYATVRLARRLGVPIVVTAHGSDVHAHPARNRRIASCTRDVIESADRVTAVSDYLSKGVVRLGKPRAPVLTIRLGVDTTLFRPHCAGEVRAALGLPGDGPGLVSVSRVTEEKGVLDLVDAFVRLSAELPSAWLALVGDGPAMPEVRKRVRMNHLDDRVFLPGVLSHSAVSQWLGAADVFVLASHAEGLPNVVLEAMACGLPIVATDAGGTREAVSSECGILIPPGDAGALRHALERLAGSEETRIQMGRAAANRARSRFSWAGTAEQYIRLYGDLARRDSARASREADV